MELQHLKNKTLFTHLYLKMPKNMDTYLKTRYYSNLILSQPIAHCYVGLHDSVPSLMIRCHFFFNIHLFITPIFLRGTPLLVNSSLGYFHLKPCVTFVHLSSIYPKKTSSKLSFLFCLKLCEFSILFRLLKTSRPQKQFSQVNLIHFE